MRQSTTYEFTIHSSIFFHFWLFTVHGMSIFLPSDWCGRYLFWPIKKHRTHQIKLLSSSAESSPASAPYLVEELHRLVSDGASPFLGVDSFDVTIFFWGHALSSCLFGVPWSQNARSLQHRSSVNAKVVQIVISFFCEIWFLFISKLSESSFFITFYTCKGNLFFSNSPFARRFKYKLRHLLFFFF